MRLNLEERLAELDRLIDPEWAELSKRRLERSFRYEEVDYLPASVGCPLDSWFQCDSREYIWEKEKTLLYRLSQVYPAAIIGDDRLMVAGTLPDSSLMATLFGANLAVARDSFWVHPIGDRKRIEEIVQNGVPDVLDGWGWKVVKECEFFLKAMEVYPNLRRNVKVIFADVQGPFDNACQLAGQEIYYWLYDSPELVDALVELMTQTQLKWYEMLKTRFSAEFAEGRAVFTAYSGAKAHLVVDHCENISPDMYARFCRPSMEAIFTSFDNRGSVHFCGKNKQIQECIIDTPGVVFVDIIQPEKCDPDFQKRINRLQERKIAFNYSNRDGQIIRKDGKEGISTGICQSIYMDSIEQAKALIGELRRISD